MDTPIYDFAKAYQSAAPARLHMPGHKGRGPLGCEGLDLTEITGADSLFEASGIIALSEQNASRLFGCPTLYSTEGSSLCIRAMVRLSCLWAELQGRAPLILAARNVHKTFLSAAALLDVPVQWLWDREASYLSASVDLIELSQALETYRPTAVYLTSPDYLGNLADLASVCALCHRHGALVLVDNAHGAYLRFTSPSLHPMDLGADLCCDSAHKTLPALTGAAYLHLSASLPEPVLHAAKEAMALFASTSPSYLILASLDLTNPALEALPCALQSFLPSLDRVCADLRAAGYCVSRPEPMKLTIRPKSRGYTGLQLAALLEKASIFPEFADPDHLVLMPSPHNTAQELEALVRVLCSLALLAPLEDAPPARARPVKAMSIRRAMLSVADTLPASDCLGRILALPCVACPPAVPILMCGEVIDEAALAAFSYYGIRTLRVVRQNDFSPNT